MSRLLTTTILGAALFLGTAGTSQANHFRFYGGSGYGGYYGGYRGSYGYGYRAPSLYFPPQVYVGGFYGAAYPGYYGGGYAYPSYGYAVPNYSSYWPASAYSYTYPSYSYPVVGYGSYGW
jgi:hypothetical protein